jgi:type I restriction enzyme S subunit
MLPKGSVLFSSRAPIGYVAIAKNELCTNQGFKSVVPFDWVGSEFVYQLLRMMTPVIEERASGSTFKEISSSGMKELPVIVPSKNMLHEFSSITLPMGESQKSLEDETRVLAEMRDALLPKLMSGEIDVEKVKVA